MVMKDIPDMAIKVSLSERVRPPMTRGADLINRTQTQPAIRSPRIIKAVGWNRKVASVVVSITTR
jgi:flagellar biosynthesis regulator FlaF